MAMGITRREQVTPHPDEIRYARETAPIVLDDGRTMVNPKARHADPGMLPFKVVEKIESKIVDKRAKMRDKICFILTVWPRLSPSMLHTGIGPGTPHNLWRPVLEELKRDGTVIQQEIGLNTHLGQYRPFTIIKLAPVVFDRLRARYQMPILVEEDFEDLTASATEPDVYEPLEPIERASSVVETPDPDMIEEQDYTEDEDEDEDENEAAEFSEE